MSLISYAQNYEDVMLWRALQDVENGFFIDVGAQSPDLDSVTRAFSDAGWRGINIEPHPDYFSQLVSRRPRDINLCCAVGDRSGVIVMHYIEGTGLSTADESVAAGHVAAGYAVRRNEAELTTLDQVWQTYVPPGQPVHFLKVDVEGFEVQVLRGNNWSLHRPWVVVVESTLPNSQVENHSLWEHVLLDAGYDYAYEDGLNRYYVAQEHSELRRAFRFPPNVFDAFEPIATLMERDRAAQFESALAVERREVANAKDREERLARDLASRDDELAQMRRDLARATRAAAEAARRIVVAEASFLAARKREGLAHDAKRESEMRLGQHDAARAIAQSDAEVARRQVQEIMDSNSWRLTAPLRMASTRLPTALRSQLRRSAKLAWWVVTPWKLPARIRFIRARDVAAREQAHAAIDLTDPWAGRWKEFSLHDDAALVQLGAQELRTAVPLESGSLRIADRPAAMAAILEVLRRNPAVRERFPLALSDPQGSGFLPWLLSGESALQLDAQAEPWVKLVLQEDVAARPRQIYLFRDDVRKQWPHGLTPVGHSGLIRWFFVHARAEYGLRDVEILWLFMRAAEQPALELTRAFVFNPEWQTQFPDGLSVFGSKDFSAWFRRTYGADEWWVDPQAWPQLNSPASHVRQAFHARSAWRRLFPLALNRESDALRLVTAIRKGQLTVDDAARDWCLSQDAKELAISIVAPGINLLGHFCSASGVRVSAENLADGLVSNGVAVSKRTLRTDIADENTYVHYSALEDFDVTIVHTQPTPYFGDAYALANLPRRENASYQIAFWYWEFDSIPETWKSIAATVDEVWAATEFVASGLRRTLSVPVRTVFPGVRLPTFQSRERASFGLNAGDFVFLFVFHMNSVIERKNPLGLIRAFKRAFASERSVKLVLKTVYGHHHPSEMEKLRRVADSENILLIDEIYDQSTLLALIDVCDAYVSLHRSEGLGLTMAEAMLLGKPVIATGYSGNLDFMDETNSLLVSYELRKLGRDMPPYEATATWAEPCVEHAAEHMRRLFDDRDFAKELGRKAKQSAEERLSVAKAGERAAAVLEEIRAKRRLM